YGRERSINEADVTDDLQPFGQRDNGRDALVLDQHVIRRDAGDQVIAVRLGTTQQVQMADMKEIIGARGVTYADHGSGSRSQQWVSPWSSYCCRFGLTLRFPL